MAVYAKPQRIIKTKKIIPLFLAVMLSAGGAFAQKSPEKIKIKKQDSAFFFFQVGKQADTISEGKGDLFYLKLSEENRCHVRISIQNGQLKRMDSDTLFKLIRITNINYTHFFADSTGTKETKKNNLVKKEKVVKRCFKFVTGPDGAGNFGNPFLITIRFYDRKTNKLLLTNNFYYR